MALQSQMINAGTRSQFMMSRTRPRRPRRWPLIAIVTVVLASLAWLVWPERDSNESPGELDPALVAAADETETAPAVALPSADASPAANERGSVAAGRNTASPSAPATSGTRSEPAREPGAVAVTTPPPSPPAPVAESTAAKPQPLPVLSASESVPAQNRVSAPPPAGRIATLVALADSEPVETRAALTEAYLSGTLAPADARLVLATLDRINARLLFSPEPVQNDPFSRIYLVQPGDSLERIARRETAGGADWRFLQRINRIKNPRGIQINQRIKLPVGTFHAVIDKSDFRMDLFLVDNGNRVLVASYPVGLGELNSTPEGLAKVRKGSKLIDPEWYNPRTGEYFAAGDGKNPIGEHWIGLSSLAEGDRLFDGYGIHGTIEPDSIGKSVSMGCVRMLPEHVEVVYEMLTEPESTVEVRR